MQFAYRVSEADYQRAWKLRVKGSFGDSTVVKTIMFWVFILVCLMMLWAVVTKTSERTAESSPPTVEESNEDASGASDSRGSSALSLLQNVGPFVLFGGIWVFMLFGLRPRVMRRQYQKDPLMQGVFTVDISLAELAVENTAGLSSHLGWNLFEFWKESKGVFVLVYKSGTHFIIGATELSEPQQSELREILSTALQKK